MKKLILLFVLFLLAVPAYNPSPAVQVFPTTCIVVSDGKWCMEFLENTPTPTLEPTETPTLAETSTQTATSTPTNTSTSTPTSTPTNAPTNTPTSTPTPTKIPFADFSGDLFRHPGNPLIGTISGGDWNWPATALSSSTKSIWANYMQGRQVVQVWWLLVWNPNTDNSPTGVRLVLADNGPSNIQEIARIDGMNYHNPRVESRDITTSIQTLLDNGTYKIIGEQTYGNGVNGCLIYASTLYVIWK